MQRHPYKHITGKGGIRRLKSLEDALSKKGGEGYIRLSCFSPSKE